MPKNQNSLLPARQFKRIFFLYLAGGLAPLASGKDPTLSWLALLHYQIGYFSTKSTIDNPEFFFAADGKTNPNAELEASRKALANGLPKVGVLDPQCAFPARSHYFAEYFGDKPRDVSCDGFEHWRQHLQVKSLSMVFSSAYLGNPASMLGHTFIKLNLANNKTDTSPLLDYGASFAAYPENDPEFIYMIKGLTGGYRGVLTLDPYYSHVLTYAYRENRDLWEYELDLTPKELVYFIEHLWELFAASSIDYYFLDDNCASILIEALDAVRPELHLSQKKGLFVLPQQTLKLALLMQKDKRVKAFPSQRRLFHGMLTTAAYQEKHELRQTLFYNKISNNPVVLDLALAYINLEKASVKFDQQQKIRELEETILTKRASYAVAPLAQPEVLPKNYFSPEQAHEPAKIGLYSDSQKTFIARVRLGHHDLLDPPQGFEPYYHMDYLDLTYHRGKNQSWNFRLVDVVSLAPFRDFEYFSSWRIGGGLRQDNWEDKNLNSEAYFYCGVGYALELIPRKLLLYSLPGPRIAVGTQDKPRLDLDIDLSFYWAALSTTRISISHLLTHQFMPIKARNTTSTKIAVSYDLSLALSIEGEWLRDKNRRVQTLGMGYRF